MHFFQVNNIQKLGVNENKLSIDKLCTGKIVFGIYHKTGNNAVNQRLYVKNETTCATIQVKGMKSACIRYISEVPFGKECDNLWDFLRKNTLAWNVGLLNAYIPRGEDRSLAPRVPKMNILFHTEEGSRFYVPHPPHILVYPSRSIEGFTVVKEFLETASDYFKYKYNSIQVILMKDKDAGISWHADCSQVEGIAMEEGGEGNENIASISLFGDRWMDFNVKSTGEFVRLAHRHHSAYCMEGVQKVMVHRKPHLSFNNSRMSKFITGKVMHSTFQVVAVLRRLTVLDSRYGENYVPNVLTITPSLKDINNIQIDVIQSQERYMGLNEREPIGTLYPSKYSLYFAGAHKQIMGGIDGLPGDNPAYSLISDPSRSTDILTGPDPQYKGHASNEPNLNRYNYKLLLNLLRQTPLRVYQKCAQGYKLEQVAFIEQMALHYCRDKKYRWTCHLRKKALNEEQALDAVQHALRGLELGKKHFKDKGRFDASTPTSHVRCGNGDGESSPPKKKQKLL